MLGGGGGGGAGGCAATLERKKPKRVSADEEDDEDDDYRKRDHMYGCMYVCTLDMHTCTCLVPYMRFPVQKLLVLINYFLASYMGNMN